MKRLLSIFALLLILTSCEITPTPTLLKVTNNSTDKATFTVDGEDAEIKGFESHVFELDDALESVYVFAEGGYFLYYYEEKELYPKTLNEFTASPNIGWVGLMNNSSSSLYFPKYGDEYFFYDSEFVFDGADGGGVSTPSTQRYLKVGEDTEDFQDITFKTYDSVVTYRILFTNIDPALGETINVVFSDISYIQEVSRLF